MTIVKRLNGKIQNVVYHPGSREVFQGVKKGTVLKSYPGMYQRELRNGNGEVIISAQFLVEIDLGMREDHPERWILINIISDVHYRRWTRLTKRRQHALKATKPACVNVLYHCSNDNDCFYTIDSSDMEKWLDSAEHYLKYGIEKSLKF